MNIYMWALCTALAVQQNVARFEFFAALFNSGLQAGGLGLNLTSANVVIQFNPTWNPAHDVQAQDRAFRIGQRRHVTVYRLISMGTVDELMYMRQINKITVGNHTLTGASATRLYEGVSGETHGDLFGIENIFRYSRSGFEQSHLVHRRSERRKAFRLMNCGIVQSEHIASRKQPPLKALLTRPQIDGTLHSILYFSGLRLLFHEYATLLICVPNKFQSMCWNRE